MFAARDEILSDRVLDDKIAKMCVTDHTTDSDKQIDLTDEVSNFSLLSALSSQPLVGPVTIENSENVHVGNVIYINNIRVVDNPGWTMVSKDRKPQFPLIRRIEWLAQPSVNPKEYLEEPARFVIISHTATEEGFSQAENVLLARLTQTFHIESRGWDDIAYNFMIGSDGNVYEGRGWNVVGSHTQGYNARSVGIAFIGCFLNNLPPATSLLKCKNLIEFGVKIGAIRQDYQLLGQCQCRPFLSPGQRLFDEIKTWENWNENVTPSNPGV
ncbi:peptidoglycan-recognition protein LE-like [Cylas formicarius]|uniref:peptidoglycan-recognition protein LE-like n=1 Tax=Cylas formicarius TaxID=197179 RepID=UPI0029586CAE|nr:peptidoglycan-recognition protein LE-like [Cylas formicarius]